MESPPAMAPPGFQPVSDDASQQWRQWGLFAHLAALGGLVVPFGAILGPLVVWLIKRRESRFLDANGAHAVNWNITMQMAALLLLIPGFLVFIQARANLEPTATLQAFGTLLLFAFAAGAIVVTEYIFAVIGGVRANDGHVYRYPFSIRFVKPAAA